MPWVSKEQLAQARQVDLLTYLQERAPHELVRSAPGEYRTVRHGSLVISNGAWYWNRGQFGGVSALDYLTKVQGVGLVDAVEMIDGIRTPAIAPPLPVKKAQRPGAEKRLLLPPQSKYPTRLLSYLQDRGIHPDIIKQCLADGSLYEGRYSGGPVCVFVGRDDAGASRFACMRGITSDLKRDCAGSDKRFSFCMRARDAPGSALAVLESPIDALSHLCLYPGIDAHRLSLGGTSDAALLSFLERNPQINHVSLCLDADAAGQTAAQKIESALAGDARFAHIRVTIDPPTMGKDYNEALLYTIEKERVWPGHRKVAGFSH